MDRKNIFQIIPDNFFSPLSSPGKAVYWECIEILFRTSSSQLSFGVERDARSERYLHQTANEFAAQDSISPEEAREKTLDMLQLCSSCFGRC